MYLISLNDLAHVRLLAECRAAKFLAEKWISIYFILGDVPHVCGGVQALRSSDVLPNV